MMIYLTQSLSVILLILGYVAAEVSQELTDVERETDELGDDTILHKESNEPLENVDHTDNIIEKAIQEFEKMAAYAREEPNLASSLTEDQEKMMILLKNMTETVLNTDHANKFLKAKGIDRIIAPNLKIAELKTNILILIKVLFEVAPSKTSAVIPVHIVDSVLDIFENDDVALKAHAIDVLHKWLPQNPKIQTQVMRLAGLQPFLEQIPKLDTSVVKTLLNLFNKILTEHLAVRNDRKTNKEISKMYQRIGLIEHISTRPACEQLLNIFATSWVYNTNENNIIFTVFDLMRSVKQLCVKYFQGKTKAKEVFGKLLEYAKRPENGEYFEAHGVNVYDVMAEIEDYLINIQHYQKEFSDEL